jgi:methionyl-tRNA formyltransferase
MEQRDLPHSPPTKGRIILFGAGSGVAEVLKLLVAEAAYEVCFVVPRVNRKTEDPDNSEALIQTAADLGLKVVKARDINDAGFLNEIREVAPDLLVNWGYGQVFKRNLLSLPKLGVLNFHPGLLPAGRGTGAVVGEIWNDQKEIGQVAHFMDEDIDKGRIVLRRSFPISGYEYQDEINQQLAKGAAEFLVKAIHKAFSGDQGTITTGFGRYYPKFSPGDDIVDWSKPTDFLIRRIRSRSPNLLSRTFKTSDKTEVFIRRASKGDVQPYFSPVGQVIDKSEERGILVKTGDTALWLEEISLDGQEFVVPSFPIGTTFLSNWLHEHLLLQKQIDELRAEVERLKMSHAPSERS